MALTKPFHFSSYDEIKVPEGFYLRHHEAGARHDRPSYRSIVLCEERTEKAVCELEEYFDAAAGCARFGAIVKNKGSIVHRDDDYSLQKLFLRVCTRHKVLGGINE